MNINHQIFSGVFADEIGQRLLKIMSVSAYNAFQELCDACVPHNIKRLNECLQKVQYWDRSIINSEFDKLQSEFVDCLSTFKQTYINYVKAIRGNPQVKISISLPKFQTFLHTFWIHTAQNPFMKDGRYFQCGPIEQKCICMDCIRTSLYEYIGDDYVRIEERSQVGSTRAPVPSIPQSIPEEEPTSEEEDDIVPEDSISQIEPYYNRKIKESPRSNESSSQNDDGASVSLSSVTLSHTGRRQASTTSQGSGSQYKKSSRGEHQRRDDTPSVSDYYHASEPNSKHRREERDERDDTSNVSDRKHRRDDRRDEHRRDEHRRREERDDASNVSDRKRRKEERDERDDASNVSDRKRRQEERDERDDASSAAYRRRGDGGSAISNSSVSRERHQHDRRNRDYEEEEDQASGESSSDDDDKKKSPCRSYVTQLTELSKMTSEY